MGVAGPAAFAWRRCLTPRRGSVSSRRYRLHPLTGDRRGQWSVRVSGNWRIVFRFEDGAAWT